jgi:hypothetical protein
VKDEKRPAGQQGEPMMTDDRKPTPSSPPPEGREANTLLPMLVGGLVLITIGMIVVAIAV